MHVTVATLLALQCTLCHAIRVPIAWNDENSEVNNYKQFSYEEFKPQNFANTNQKDIPKEYFQYTAQKPKFAVDIAKSHGVQSPEDRYKAYLIKAYTGLPKPKLGEHKISNKFLKKNEAIRTVSPSSTNFEVFHPYKLEEPALKELYQDPVMAKIRSDIENNKNRLQKYEIEAGQPDIEKDEDLEDPEETDRKKVPHKNVPAPYEIHHPQRQPVYYKPPNVHNQREQILNQKFRHPWHQNHIKVKPLHYHPVKNHLLRLRQQHALKYDDERNEYPQLPIPEKHSEIPEGYDIYEKGKAKFVKLRNNVDESINDAVQKHEPSQKQKVELDDDDYDEDTNSDDEEDEFVPIKNYAQVRKTETTKHLPKEAAYHDADTLEDIENAPRLREAIKSTKAQTVYSEEGYEDSAYDHAGEQKHASDHEEHRGSLKQKDDSKGKFKAPTFSNNFEEVGGSEYRDTILDGKKWEDTKENKDTETDLEEYSENEQDHSDERNNYVHKSKQHLNNEDDENNESSYDTVQDKIKRIKREPISSSKSNNENISKSTEKNNLEYEEIRSLRKTEDSIKNVNKKLRAHKIAHINDKYPYYYNNFQEINKNSPLRYAENLKFMPKKSEGDTAFYDSRAKLQCPEVEDDIDPIPEKLKKDGHPDEDEDDEPESSRDEADKTDSDGPRLNGLGDKIDCFKAKYFGENPLDSPFFKEEIIQNPEPPLNPNKGIYKLKEATQISTRNLKPNDLYLQPSVKDVVPVLLKTNDRPILVSPDISQNSQSNSKSANITRALQQQHVTKYLERVRKRRAATFVYEPYKIIRDSQIQDSKKTTTTNNISPLIKHLQSSRVVDKVSTSNAGKDQIVKRSAGTRTYKDIGKNEREKNNESKGSQPLYDAGFVDVSVDNRRGEPRYELRSINHKSEYSPVQIRKSMSADNYKTQIKNIDQQDDKLHNKTKTRRRRTTTTTIRPNFEAFEKSAESNESTEQYAEVEDDVKENVKSTTTKTPSRRKLIDTSTTVNTESKHDLPLSGLPKLRLVTRFQNSYQPDKPIIPQSTETSTHEHEDNKRSKVPKYREKKKRISKSTLVTDTNSYGEDNDDDLSKEGEVDALIGVKHDIEEYLPTYELESDNKDTSGDNKSESEEGDEEFEEDEHNYEDDDDDEKSEEPDYEDDEEIEEDENTEIEDDLKSETTTQKARPKTSTKTTELPTTTDARSAKLEVQPVTVKKKLDIHKELPVNRSSPHITEFKQDIKEVEIIKEVPSRIRKKPQKNIEALELYKDENLAKDINKLGGVEVFKEGLDFINGPKHGGNYRSSEIANTEDSSSASSHQIKKEISSKSDVVASPSKTSKIVEIKDDPYSRRRGNIQRVRNNRNRSAKLIELSDATEKTTSRPMHGGNLRSIHEIRRRGGPRTGKIVELIDQPNRDDHSTNQHGSNSRSYGSRGGGRYQMHGGNYRSAKLEDDQAQTKEVPKRESSTNERLNSAVLLNSFASAVSVLTTSPTPYILDPSKRMYYYVEA